MFFLFKNLYSLHSWGVAWAYPPEPYQKFFPGAGAVQKMMRYRSTACQCYIFHIIISHADNDLKWAMPSAVGEEKISNDKAKLILGIHNEQKVNLVLRLWSRVVAK
jgi:hypothetical protein